MTHLVTRCPKCATAFRLTSNQLESARGSVRCGSCLHIFKAQDHLAAGSAAANQAASRPTPLTTTVTTASNTKAATAKSTVSAKPTSSSSADQKTPAKRVSIPTPINRAKVFEDEEDSLISDDMDKVTAKESTYEFDGFLDVNLQPKQNASIFDRKISYEAPVEKEHIDESWADNLLDDEGPQKFAKTQPMSPQGAKPSQGAKSPSPQGTKPSQAAKQQHDEHKQQPSASNKKPEAPKHQNVQNHKAPVFSFVNETKANEDESEFSDEFMYATRAHEPNNSNMEDQSAVFAAGLFTGEEEFEGAQATKRQLKNSPKIQAINPSRAALLMNIIPAPIEFTANRMRNLNQQQLWLGLSILAAITLLFQVAYFKFNYFSRVEPYRSAYTVLCPVFRCTVPSLVDTSQISAYNLVVRNHPQAQNALMVDAIILNKAPFDQPFPDLTLAFSTVEEIPVTSRQFTPKEYLGGELAGMKYIPPNQPVHITLELADPGPDAVNYHMSIAP